METPEYYGIELRDFKRGGQDSYRLGISTLVSIYESARNLEQLLELEKEYDPSFILLTSPERASMDWIEDQRIIHLSTGIALPMSTTFKEWAQEVREIRMRWVTSACSTLAIVIAHQEYDSDPEFQAAREKIRSSTEFEADLAMLNIAFIKTATDPESVFMLEINLEIEEEPLADTVN